MVRENTDESRTVSYTHLAAEAPKAEKKTAAKNAAAAKTAEVKAEAPKAAEKKAEAPKAEPKKPAAKKNGKK